MEGPRTEPAARAAAPSSSEAPSTTTPAAISPSQGHQHLLQPRSTWSSAIGETVRNSISSFRSFRPPGTAPPDDIALVDLEKAGILVADGAASIRPPEFLPIPRPLTLMTLPFEMQLSIIRHMPFGDIERLRRTCKHYQRVASPEIMRLTFGAEDLKSMLMAHCRQCLFFDVSGEHLLHAEDGRDYPFSAKCIPCAVRMRDARLSRRTIAEKVTLGNLVKVWVCRWCSMPVTAPPVQTTPQGSHAQFHDPCYHAYTRVLVWFFVVGWVQLASGLAAAALVWRHFRFVTVVFAPSVAGFILMWFTIFLLLFRGNNVRTYGLGLLFELLILGCLVPQILYTTLLWADAEDPAQVFYTTKVTTVFIALNMLFRLLNVLGNTLLWMEYDMSRHHLPGVPIWRKLLVNPVAGWLICWTYPQSVEQRYRPAPRLVSFFQRKLFHKFVFKTQNLSASGV